MKVIKIIALLLIVMPLFAQAAERYKVADLPLDRCELQEVIARMTIESIQNAGAIAEQSIPNS